MTIRPGHTPDEIRDLQREVALTYRRVQRRRRAEGAPVQEAELAAVDAAIDVYQRLDPDAPTDRVEASATAIAMISNAIRVNKDWFWHGPDV